MVDLEMLVEGYPAHGTDLGNVDFAQIARAAGLDAIGVTEPSELRVGLAQALASPKPTLVDVATDPNALSVLRT